MAQALDSKTSGRLPQMWRGTHADAADRRQASRRAPSLSFGPFPTVDEVDVSCHKGGLRACAIPDLAHRRTDYWLSPFQLPGWRRAWHEALGAPRNIVPVTATLTRQQRTLAVLPFAIQETAWMRVLTWHAADQSDYGAPIVARDQLEHFCRLDGSRLLQRIARAAGGADLVYLPRQPATIAGFANPLVVRGSVPHHAGAHAITFLPGESWDDFLLRRRSASTRQQLRKKQRGLAKLGTIAFQVAATPAEARAITEHCLAAKSRQLARLGHYDPFASPDVRQFLIDYFADEAGKAGWAAALTLDGRIIASSIGFAMPGEWLLYQMAMDEESAAHLSPGTQLLMHIMQHCIANGVGRLDLALGDESYKFEWCDEHQVLYNSTLPFTVSGRLAGAAARIRAHVQRRMAAHPLIYDAGKALKRRLRALRVDL